MTERFNVRTTPKGFGVFDAAVNGWHGQQDLTKDAADQVAADMNGKVGVRRVQTQTGAGSRQVAPAKRVKVHVHEVWREGTLDWWVREKDGWHGRVKDSISGKTEWLHADRIRPAT